MDYIDLELSGSGCRSPYWILGHGREDGGIMGCKGTGSFPIELWKILLGRAQSGGCST
jgi:hypothetical protein